MVNRLKTLLPSLISMEQIGFVKGRQILERIVTTQEENDYLRTLKVKGMLIKLDLSKEYDCVSLPYMIVVLKSFGFDNRWIQWLNFFISSPNFSILLNGVPSQPFNISRGIPQGVPLSPFLFILVAEGFGRIIKA